MSNTWLDRGADVIKNNAEKQVVVEGNTENILEHERVNSELFKSFYKNYLTDEMFQAYCYSFGKSIQEITDELIVEMQVLIDNPQYYNECGVTLKQYIQEYLLDYNLAQYLLLNNYLDKLALKYEQLVYVDDYGDVNEFEFEKEISLFYKRRSSVITDFILSFDTHNLYEDKVKEKISNKPEWIKVHLKYVVESFIKNNVTDIAPDSNEVTYRQVFEYFVKANCDKTPKAQIKTLETSEKSKWTIGNIIGGMFLLGVLSNVFNSEDNSSRSGASKRQIDARVYCKDALENVATYGAKIPFGSTTVYPNKDGVSFRVIMDAQIKNAFGVWANSRASCFITNNNVTELIVNGYRIK